MAGIDSVSQIVALMRAQMEVGIRRSGQLPEQSGHKSIKGKASKNAKAPVEVEELITQRIQSLNPDDPKRGKKTFRIFLESVLLSELGENLINDPRFYEMVSHIQSAMEEDPHISGLIDKAVNELLNRIKDR